MIPNAEALLKPLHLKRLTIRNRVMSTSHAPGYGKDGKPQERYQLYHAKKAEGGNRFDDVRRLGLRRARQPRDAVEPDLRRRRQRDPLFPVFRRARPRLTRKNDDPAHPHGRRTRWTRPTGWPTLSASPRREPASRSIPREMEIEDIARVVADYAAAARRAHEGGLDGCEIMASAGHLIDQFFSPSVNQRTDGYGGSLSNRMRLGSRGAGGDAPGDRRRFRHRHPPRRATNCSRRG